MRKFIAAFVFILAALGGPVELARAESPTAGNIFAMMGGTTTIDQGGSIHSQARSIYSLGGGMTSFQGKRISLLAADPPSFSAGCSGISWHFGGFAFISVDEIRQLVEAISQASLGIAVDLAMQTLCPQCYAVMAKLRDIANQMRNAAADSCKVAQNFGAMLKSSGFFPADKAIKDCSEAKTEDNSVGSQLEAGFSLCGTLNAAQTAMTTVGDDINKFLNGIPTSTGKTPDKDKLDAAGNMTYQALTALGYKDGFIKDVLLSFLGMEIVRPEPTSDCTPAFANLRGSSKTDSVPAAKNEPPPAEPAMAATWRSEAASGDINERSDYAPPEGNSTSAGTPAVTVKAADDSTPPSVSDAALAAANPAPTGATKGKMVCHAPPILKGIALEELANKLVCGFDPDSDAAFFSAKFPGINLNNEKSGSIGMLCRKSVVNKIYATTGFQSADNPSLYRCDSTTAGCTQPKMQRLSDAITLASGNASTYTGLAWMVMDALYSGVFAVMNNTPLPNETISMLNGSGYPLYRLINLAAVYPGTADELLQAYGAIISVHYAMDTLTKLAMPGGNAQISLIPAKGGIDRKELNELHSKIMRMVHESGQVTDQTLRRLDEKRALVRTIVDINKALQAEVISQGLGGNADLAVSIKKQLAAPAP